MEKLKQYREVLFTMWYGASMTPCNVSFPIALSGSPGNPGSPGYYSKLRGEFVRLHGCHNRASMNCQGGKAYTGISRNIFQSNLLAWQSQGATFSPVIRFF